MDMRGLIGKLDTLNEGTMADAKKKPTGPKHTGKWRGTDPASAAKDKYVGGESILRDLESKLNEDPVKRDLAKEYETFKKAKTWDDYGQPPVVKNKPQEKVYHSWQHYDKEKEVAENAEGLNIGDPVVIAGPVMYEGSTGEIVEFTKDKRFVVVDLYNHGKHAFHSADVQYNDYADSDDEEAGMHDRGEFSIDEATVPPNQPQQQQQSQPNKPTLGTDLTKPGTPQQQQKPDPAQQAAQQKLAQQEKMDQANLQKGVASLKAAGAAVSNPAQVVKAFDKVDDQQPLTPGDKGAVATAGTVLAPIMANPQLQGKFKDLVTQASAEQKKQQQMQQTAAGAVGAPVPGQK